MSWSAYGSFLAFAVVLVLVPGPDFAVVTKNTLAGGRRPGVWSAVGVSTPNAVQGIAALALTHAVLSLLCLVVLVGGMQRARRVLTRRRVRRALDAATGTAPLGFSARLATE